MKSLWYLDFCTHTKKLWLKFKQTMKIPCHCLFNYATCTLVNVLRNPAVRNVRTSWPFLLYVLSFVHQCIVRNFFKETVACDFWVSKFFPMNQHLIGFWRTPVNIFEFCFDLAEIFKEKRKIFANDPQTFWLSARYPAEKHAVPWMSIFRYTG